MKIAPVFGAVALLLVGWTPVLYGQTGHQEPPPVAEIIGQTWGGTSGGSSGTSTNQVQLALTSSAGTIVVALGSTRDQVLTAFGGNEMILSLFENANLIAFDSEGNLILGSAFETGEMTLKPLPESTEAKPVGEEKKPAKGAKPGGKG